MHSAIIPRGWGGFLYAAIRPLSGNGFPPDTYRPGLNSLPSGGPHALPRNTVLAGHVVCHAFMHI